jgi:phosphoribosylanthranilate isomerase
MPSRLTFRAAHAADIPARRDLAERVWRTSYAAMLSPSQIDYMLDWMYAPATIRAEMERGVAWTLAELDRHPVGYLALSFDGAQAELHKLYLLPDRQGSGLGQEMLREARDAAVAGGAQVLRLRVNKTNARALRSYERAGFRIVDALVAEIGGGFVMDDYVLSLPLDARSPLVKICGLSTPETLGAALTAGADQIGLVFFPKSPRHVSLDRARELADQARGHAEIVALTVDADDATLDTIVATVRPDWLQLHGQETHDRVAAIKARSGLRIMKAVGVATRADLAAAAAYTETADRLLLDAKPPKNAVLPGGNGVRFEWSILHGFAGPFMLSGGLSPHNVAEAIRIARPAAVDISSGVETAPGQKDSALIAAFVATARAASAPDPQ